MSQQKRKKLCRTPDLSATRSGSWRSILPANAVSFPSLHALTVRCCEILSCPVPELYITTNPVLNAYTAGQRRTCIVLHSGLIETLTPDELCFGIDEIKKAA